MEDAAIKEGFQQLKSRDKYK